ncbi:hypothetical protein Taro_044730 [Colocasia esculenta]|uniref:Uncharacterized protein n=1 Tax=Colocasia esculenta TaxID=4460 RepID=A0A843WPF7_COLES|nr:hypothetical protein [Colocasia esculenta]
MVRSLVFFSGVEALLQRGGIPRVEAQPSSLTPHPSLFPVYFSLHFPVPHQLSIRAPTIPSSPVVPLRTEEPPLGLVILVLRRAPVCSPPRPIRHRLPFHAPTTHVHRRHVPAPATLHPRRLQTPRSLPTLGANGINVSGELVGTSEPRIGPTRSKFTQTEATSSDYSVHLAWRLPCLLQRGGIPIAQALLQRGGIPRVEAQPSSFTPHPSLFPVCFSLHFPVPHHFLCFLCRYDPSTGIYGMDFYVVLERAGYRVARRRHCNSRVGIQHRVTKEDSMKWFQVKYEGVMLNKLQTAGQS